MKVLRHKIAKELPDILPLTVSVLGEDSESRKNLEESVRGILRRENAISPTDSQRQIDTKLRERRSLQSQLADLRRRQHEVREAETTVYCVPGTPYQGTAQAIAQAVSRDSQCLSWLTDQIGEKAEPPLSDEELRELYSLWGRCRNHPLGHALPAIDSLPTADQFEKATDTYSRSRQDFVTRFGARGNRPVVKAPCARERGQLHRLCTLLREIIQRIDRLATRNDPWLGRAWRKSGWPRQGMEFAGERDQRGPGVSCQLSRHGRLGPANPCGTFSRATAVRRQCSSFPPEIRGWFGLWPFRHKVVKRCAYVWRSTRFGGRKCDSISVLESLIAHLRAQDTLDRAWREWSDIVEPPQGTVRHRLARLEQCRDALRGILQLGGLVSEAEEATGAKADASLRYGKAWAEELLGDLHAALGVLDAKDALAIVSGMAEDVSQSRKLSNPHPIVNDLAAAAAQHNAAQYREQLRRLGEIHHERALTQRCLSLDKRLRELAPKLADAIKSPETRPALATGLSSFSRAWAWKRAKAWLERFIAEHSAGIEDQITKTEDGLRKATQTLVALKAWKSCMERLASEPMQRRELAAWQLLFEKTAKTGKNVEAQRRDARKHLQRCRGAVPAWIMPLYRVAEQIEPEPEIFDVVIVDEASQTGPEGLILQYLAKQCMIVGDNKQISPERGFVDESQIRDLMEKYIYDIPAYETLHPAFSLFDHAYQRHGTPITLREHFRCMPEIIRFSNDLFYEGALIPLRQYPPSRLPPIQVCFVTDGYHEGRSENKINRPEAAAVAKTVIDCLNDPRYKGKSFGVICLQGHAQAEVIENMILEKVGPQPFKDEKTRLLCGDPYSFQGDERDIIFLSMVESGDGEGRSVPLTGPTFRKRFNVAASRTRPGVAVSQHPRKRPEQPGLHAPPSAAFLLLPRGEQLGKLGSRAL